LVATADPGDRATLDSVARSLGAPVRAVMADPDSLTLAINSTLTLLSGRTVAVGEAPDAVALFDRVMKEAFLRRASDIHLEPEAIGLRIRLRIDGRLRTFMSGLEPAVGISLVSRVKVL